MWGYRVDCGAGFPVKGLSLRKRGSRAGSRVVTDTAKAACGEGLFSLTKNKSGYFPVGEAHRFSNPSKTDLELIKIQSDSYLEKDDIVCIEDVYGCG